MSGFEMAMFFPFKGSKGCRVQSVYTLGEFWVPEIQGGALRYFFRVKGVQALVARKEQRVRA